MKRVTIPADTQRGFSHAITIVLGDDIEDKYEVVAKDFPAGLPSTWTSPWHNILDFQFRIKNAGWCFCRRIALGRGIYH